MCESRSHPDTLLCFENISLENMQVNTIISILQKRYFVLPTRAVARASEPSSLVSRSGLRRLVENCSLKRDRSEQTYACFARFFADKGIPHSLLEGAYNVLARKSLFGNFPVHPKDSLARVYGIDCYRDDEVVDLLNLIEKSCSMEFCKPVPVFLPCETVEDLVCLLAVRCGAVSLSLRSEPLHSPSGIQQM